jgi:hypothetical protein
MLILILDHSPEGTRSTPNPSKTIKPSLTPRDSPLNWPRKNHSQAAEQRNKAKFLKFSKSFSSLPHATNASAAETTTKAHLLMKWHC